MSFVRALVVVAVFLAMALPAFAGDPTTQPYAKYVLDFISRTDPALQSSVEKIDTELRDKFGMTREQTAVGVLDLTGNEHLALLNPDRMDYGASVPKIGILLAYFDLTPRAATQLDPTVRKELGQMIKNSNNEMASKYSHLLGLKAVQGVIEKYKLWDPNHGGGIWVGKHYGKDAERYPDPITKNSHAITVRQVMRFYLLMLQGKLVSPEASQRMLEIFESPDLPHDQNKFVKGLAGRDGVNVIRKSGTWDTWFHDSAIITAPGRRYILVAMTNHPKGDEYLEALAPRVDDLLKPSKQ
jgi:beta-lactamase class A